MEKKLLIERDPYESRVAVLEDNRLAEVYLEDRTARDEVGNIYKGRVTRVLPGIQAAFVDIGLDREAFLYVADATQRGRAPVEEEDDGGSERSRIQDLVQAGEEILVQVIKASLKSKGARITTQISLPGRLLVLLPFDSQVGVSRRIGEEEERERLRRIVTELDSEHGVIVRTVAQRRDHAEFERDLEYLVELWRSILDRAAGQRAPAIVHRDLDLPQRALRDLFDESFQEVLVTGDDPHQILAFLDEIRSPLRHRARAADDGSLFERFEVFAEIEGALKDTVWLKSGGHIVIHSTEALVAIDVNTGRFVGRRDLEETVLRTNLEAAREVVRQIRLRDLSGIIVIDFIDMNSLDNRRRIVELLEDELQRDRSKSQVLDMSTFGLVEITRERSRRNLRAQLTQPCPNCRGTGRVVTPRAVCLEIRRSLWHDRAQLRGRAVSVTVHPAIAEALAGELDDLRCEVERELATELLVVPDSHRRRHEFEISPR